MTHSQAPAGRLSVCPTPIGNLQDVTLRVLATIAAADVVACEDTRRTGLLLSRHGLSARLVSLHERNERARTHELVARMREGAVVALVSDSGMPLVSDPGFALVQACLQAGVPVEVLPGPSAVTTALVASGLPAERWCFTGFLPRKGTALRALLGDAHETLIAFESPRRLPSTLLVLAELDPQRPAAVCRELTKLHEEVRRGSAAELAAHYGAQRTREALRGEIVLVIGAAAAGQIARAEAAQALAELIGAGARARPAAAAVAKLTGLAANELYREVARLRAQTGAARGETGAGGGETGAGGGETGAGGAATGAARGQTGTAARR
jgi:16S rRNA (cytidine1402-2'-O)-methyltransferase